MVQTPAIFDAEILEACIDTPFDGYERIDFGHERKLERRGEYLVDYPDRLAGGEPASRHWSAGWIRRRIEVCFDLEDIRVLNLFAVGYLPSFNDLVMI